MEQQFFNSKFDCNVFMKENYNNRDVYDWPINVSCSGTFGQQKSYSRSVSAPSSDFPRPSNENPSCAIWNFGNKLWKTPCVICILHQINWETAPIITKNEYLPHFPTKLKIKCFPASWLVAAYSDTDLICNFCWLWLMTYLCHPDVLLTSLVHPDPWVNVPVSLSLRILVCDWLTGRHWQSYSWGLGLAATG